MLLDAENRYSNAQDLFAGGPGPGPQTSTDVVDRGTAGDSADELYLVVNVPTGFTSGGAATVQVILQTDSVSGFGTAVDLYTSQAFSMAELAAAKTPVKVRLPKGMKRYSRLRYVVAAAALTAGAVDAHLAKDIEHDLGF